MRETVFLNTDREMPLLGLGVYKTADNEAETAITAAVNAGYRLIDTASAYKNEESVGKAIAKCGVPRKELFITSKIWNNAQRLGDVDGAFYRSMERLKLDYLDLYLIHWPLPEPGYKDWKRLDTETWQALEELYEAGKVRAIGLSNFLPHHIENLLKNCKVKPVSDQLEFHPGYSQEAAVNYCKEHGMLVQAWSPLGRRRIMEEPLVTSLAEKYGVSPARICLKYAVERGVMPIPKASTAERMKENMDLFSFEMEKEDIYRLATMPQAGWSGEHPDRETVPAE